MPKKIKQSDNKKKSKKLINVDNIHYIFIILFVIIVSACAGVAIYKYTTDKYHAHRGNQIISFTYSEKINNEYYTYTVDDYNNQDITAGYSGDNVLKKWSKNKFLDFNEEIYLSGILDIQSEEKVENIKSNWTLEIILLDGTHKFYTDKSQIDKLEFARIISKYFNKEINYK